MHLKTMLYNTSTRTNLDRMLKTEHKIPFQDPEHKKIKLKVVLIMILKNISIFYNI